ncbi:unnamed protein product [Protopolystoma xenopodis]|uniref:Uncharacterized protein n=1 Tax=Protopolystoma xenopodis TaxID=117903 RepID=A0A448X755_9PLAT|nr:unnamed protein product [Protopolystoma xenopodis]
MKVEGTGRLLLQMDVEVNVEHKNLQKTPRNPVNAEELMSSFEVVCEPRYAGRNSSIMIMTVCGRWVGDMSF